MGRLLDIPLETLHQVAAWRNERPPVPWAECERRTGVPERTLANHLQRNRIPYIKRTELRERVQAAVAESPTATRYEIAEQVGCHPKTVSQIMRLRWARKRLAPVRMRYLHVALLGQGIVVAQWARSVVSYDCKLHHVRQTLARAERAGDLERLERDELTDAQRRLLASTGNVPDTEHVYALTRQGRQTVRDWLTGTRTIR